MTVIIMLCLASTPANACTNPSGAAGDVIFNSTHNVLQYCDTANWQMIGFQPANYVPNGIHCDGTNDYLAKGSALTGVADGKQVTASFWTKFNNTADWVRVFSSDGTGFVIGQNNSDQLEISGYNTAVTAGFQIKSTTAATDGKWHHFMLSRNAVTNAWHLYMDGVANGSLNTFGATNTTYDFTHPNWGVCASPESWNKMTGDVADLWVDFGTYIDLSIQANREKFYKNGPVYLGPDGSLPTGTAPDVFVSGDTATWHNNKGTGGGFTEYGALTDAPADPPATSATSVVPNGLVGHWKLDETTGTIVYDSAGSNNGTMQGGMTGAADTVPGRVGTALDFDGFNDYIALGTSTALQPPNVSISTWLMRTGPWTFSTIIFNAKGDDVGTLWTANGWYFEITDGNKLTFVVDGGNGARAAVDFPLNEWLHVAASFDTTSNLIKIYLNGQSLPLTLLGTPNTITTTAKNKSIGYGLNGTGTVLGMGRLDDLRIYNRAITDAEVRELYSARDGNLRYNTNYRTAEYFNGTEWIGAGPDLPTTDGLVGHWKLDEASGTFADSSGYGNAGTQSGGVAYVSAGIIGNSAGFDGNNDWITIANESAFDFDRSDSFSISAWINHEETSGWNSFVGKVPNAGTFPGYAFLVDGTNEALHFVMTDDGAGEIQLHTNWSSLLRDTWYHVVATYDGSSAASGVKIYIDGVSQTLGVFDDDLSSSILNDTALYIGNVDGGNPFQGNVDDVRIYNRALSAAEIADLYAANADPCDPKNNPAPGQACTDGSVYAGVTPDGNGHMYTTPADAGSFTWNNGNTTGHIGLGLTNTATGMSNTDAMAGADSDSGVSGVQPHRAAQACSDLNSNGYNDWYLPAQDETAVLYTNRVAIGGFQSDWYWSSTENPPTGAWHRSFTDGTNDSNNKLNSRLVRCVRKGYVPSCANPTAKEGSIIYNTTHNVLQYCNGYEWRRMGP